MPIVDYPFVDIFGFGNPKPALPVKLTNPANNFELTTWALIDTGADVTVIPEYISNRLYHDLKHKSVKTDDNWGIGGTAKAYYHTFRLKVLESDRKGKISENTVIKINKRLFSVIPGMHMMLLGEEDFLKKYVLTINYPKKIFSIRKPH